MYVQTYMLFTVRINHPVDHAMNPNCNIWRQNFYQSSSASMEHCLLTSEIVAAVPTFKGN